MMIKTGCKLNGQLCLNCGKIHLDKTGINNPMKILKNRKKQLINIRKVLKGKPKTKEHVEKNRISQTGKTMSKVSRLKNSLAKRGEKNPSFGKPAYNSKNIKYKENCMRSSWEVIFAKWLDQQELTWKYEPKRFYFKDKNFSYLPDFWVDEFDSYVEIKGWTNRNKDDVEKIQLFREKNNLILLADISVFKREVGNCG